MRLFQEKKPRPTPGRPMPASSVDVLENNFAALRAEQIAVEGRLAIAQADESAVRNEVSQLVDSLIVGTGDAATLQAARERLITISEQVVLLAGQVAQAKQLASRAEALLVERRALAQNHERDLLDHRFRAAIRLAAPALAAAATAVEEMQTVAEEAFRKYPFRSQPACPNIFFEISDLAHLLPRGSTRLIGLLKKIREQDPDAITSDVAAVIEMADRWQRDVDAVARRRDEAAAQRQTARLFSYPEAPIPADVPKPAPERTYRVQPAPDSDVLPIPIFGR